MVDINELKMIIVRSIIAIFILFITTKILGKKQLSQLTIYDYVVGITIGSIAADAIISLNEHFINGIVAILTFGLIAYILSMLALKSPLINKALNGTPVFLMESGEFNYEALKASKVTIVKLIESARLKGYYDISQINYAILETNGEISFLPKEEYQNSNPKDFKLNIKAKLAKQTYCTPLIIDGDIQEKNLKDLGKDEEWLKKELKKLNIHDEEKIVLASMNEAGKIKVYKELL